ncbi:MAG: hypothetical protein HQL53_06180 [Magnetococcales bacterium]|nr:hypothetical protein [Magnetococcales bacterium]
MAASSSAAGWGVEPGKGKSQGKYPTHIHHPPHRNGGGAQIIGWSGWNRHKALILKNKYPTLNRFLQDKIGWVKDTIAPKTHKQAHEHTIDNNQLIEVTPHFKIPP